MKTKNRIPDLIVRQDGDKMEINIHGYPVFSSRKNFCSQYKEQKNIPSVNDDHIPVSETDDFLDFAISDDEENRFYSIGADGR